MTVLTDYYIATEKQSSESNTDFWGMVYLIPTFHNPTGRCMTEAQCTSFIELVEKFNLLLICDDVYHFLWYNQPSKRLLCHKPSSRHVISNGSFSKILAPGIRLGWIEAHPTLIERLKRTGVLNSGGATNNVMSSLVSRSLTDGTLANHLVMLRYAWMLGDCTLS